MTLDDRVRELKESLDAVGWTDGAIEAALRRGIREALGRAAGAAQRYRQRHPTCAIRKRAATVIAAEILKDDAE